MKMITVCIYSTIQLPFWQGLSAQRRCPGRSAMSEKPRFRHRLLYHKHSPYRLAKYQSAPSVHKETHLTTIHIISAIVFGLALIHTFAAKSFETLAQRHPRHGGLLHLLGEVEVVFGFWTFILIIIMAFVRAAMRPSSMPNRASTRSRCSSLSSWWWPPHAPCSTPCSACLRAWRA